jgi:CheY-like chemotaxis protein
MTPALDAADPRARILIVDDEGHNRRVLEVMLAPEGFVVVSGRWNPNTWR